MRDGGIRQQALVDALNPVEHHLREFDRRQFFAVQQSCQCVRVQKSQLVVSHCVLSVVSAQAVCGERKPSSSTMLWRI